MRGLFVVVHVVLIATLVSPGTAQLPFGPQFHLSQYQATEGETEVVRLSAPILTRPQVPAFSGRIEVDITAEDLPSSDPRQNAQFGADYLVNIQNPSSRTFTVAFLSKQANSTENGIQLADDDIVEGSQAFRLRIVAARFIGQAAIIFRAQDGLTNTVADVIIKDDDSTVTIDIERRVIDVIENQTFAEVCLVKSGPSSRPVMALVNAEELTGNAGSPDYIDATSQVDFEPDVQSIILAPSVIRNCINVTIIDDKIVERKESFEVIITFPPGQPALQIGEIVPPAMQINITINIIDDDAITVEFEQDMYMVDESDGMVDVTVIASGRTSFTYTFTVTPMDLTASNNNDYNYPTTTYSFGPTDENEPIPSLIISIPIINDGDNEFDEDFKLTLEVSVDGEAANVTEGPISMTVVLIKDDDDVTVTFSPQNYTVTEGDPAPLMITLDKPAAKDITVTVTTMDITATDPDDYIGGSFDVSIPAGSVKVTLNVSTLQDSIVELPEYFKATLSLPEAPEGCVVGTPDMSYITIQDDSPMIPVWFNPANYSVKEGVDGNAVITLEAGGHNFDFTVIVNSQDGTAFNGSDYTGGPFEVTFPAGVNVVSFNVPILDDAIAECAKLFNLDLDIPEAAAGMGVIRGSPDTATVHIMDDDVEELRLSIENADYMVKENVVSFVAAVVASQAADFEYTVTVETSDDTAVGGDDFVSQQYTLTFPAGQTRAEFTVAITDDNVLEAMESFQLLLSIPQDLISKGVQVGPNSAATVTIMDNDVQVKFSQSSVATTEEEGRVPVTVEAMGDLSSDFSIIVMAINGSAVEPFDFTGNMWPVDFLANQASASFEISIVQDNLPETREEFFLKIIIENPYDERVTVGEPSRLTVITVEDLFLSIENADYMVKENIGSFVAAVIVSRAADFNYTITVETSDGTAVGGDDFVTQQYQLDFPAGQTRAEFTVVITDDSLIEGTESFQLLLSIPEDLISKGVQVGPNSAATVTIMDNDVLVKFSSTIYTATEGLDPNVTITVLANGSVDESSFSVRVIAKDGTATSGDDYVIQHSMLFFQPGQTELSFSINITDDMLAEPHEMFTLELARPQQATAVSVARGTPHIAQVRVIDDDVVTVSFSPQNYTVSEGIPATLWMVLDKEASESITVFVTTMDITAGSADYVQENGTPVKFAPGTTTAWLPMLTLRDTVINEPDESLKATLNFEPTTVQVDIGPDPCFVSIVDATVGVQFRSAMYMVGEGEGSVTVTVEASKEHPDFDFVIKMVARDGTGEILSDLHEQEVNVTFPAGKTTVEASFRINDDLIAELDETFYLVLEIPEKATVNGVIAIAPNTTEIKIIDNDDVTVTFSPQNYTVTEGDPAPLMIILDKPAAKDITVAVTTIDITATDTDDYIGGSFDVSIPAGSVKVTLNVSTLRDSIVEPAEYFKATLSLPGAPEGCVVGTPDMSYITIIDDSPMIPVRFNPANYSVKEGVDGNAVITLEALDDHDFSFTVTLRSRDGTAINGSDYSGGPFEVAFPAGVNVVSFNVPILDDAIAECTKLFNLDLDIPEAAAGMGVIRGSPDTATVHIMDDDVEDLLLSIENADYMVKENAGFFVAAVVASQAADFGYTVTFETSDGTAIGGDDFVPQKFMPYFPAGQTRAEFTVDITDDRVIEATESFRLLLSIPEDLISKGVQVGPNSVSTVTIMDNDDDMSLDTTGRCPTEEDSVWRIQWLAVAAGSTRSARCPGEGRTAELGVAYRRCLAGMPAEWGSVDASACESVAGRAVKEKTDEFIKILKKSNGTNRELTDYEHKVFQKISQEMNAVLSPSDERNRSILPRDLKTAVRFVDVLADLGANNGLFREESTKTEETVADILSNVLDERNAPAFEATDQQTDSTDPERGKAAAPAVSIIQSTERVANAIATTLSKTKPSFTIARPNLAINGQRFSFNNLQTGIVFPDSGIRDNLASFRNRESLPQLHLPQAFLRAAKGIEASLDDDTVEVVNVVMNNMENYLPSDVINHDKDVEDEPEETLPASRVISSQILGYDGREVDSKERVEVIFPVHVKSQSLPLPPGMVKQFRCAFFNFTAEEDNRTGGWSYRGVETDVINTTHVRCIASHLTSFVVLVSIVPSVGELPALDYITYIGCSISLLCLLACIIFYLTLRKELVERLHNFVHLNLCIALYLGLLFFLTGIQTATANIYACKVMTALLHYFFLATFTWTLCEAVLIYILLVKVFGANDRKWIYLYLALGWVLPIPVVVITGGARHDYYLIRASFDQSHPHYNSIKACWLPSEKGVVFAFIGPMVAIILVNAVLLTVSLVSLASRGRTFAMSSKNDEKARKYMEVGKQLLKTTIILVPLLGFTWIIGLFAVEEEGRVFAYLFVLANVFQGLFIFVLHVLRHEKVYGKIKTKLSSIRRQVALITGSVSSSVAKDTHASKSDTYSSKKGGSFALESEGIIEFGVKTIAIDEDAGSIKDMEDLDIKLNVIKENVEDGDNNPAPEIGPATTGALEKELIKGDPTDSHALQFDMENAGLSCGVATAGEQAGNSEDSEMVTAC